MLAVVETHPIQYHAPLYRLLEQEFRIPVTAVYGSDFSVAGYTDREFGTQFAWDTDLLSGYSSLFLSRVSEGGARSDREVSTHGLTQALEKLQPQALLLTGYSPRFYRDTFFQARKIRKPLLFRGETTDHALSRNPLKSFCRDFALKWLYRSCSRLLYVGHRSQRHFHRLGFDNGKLVFSPYCIDTTPFQTEEGDRELLRDRTRQDLGITDDNFVVLFSGKLSPRKAPDLLLSAVKSLPEKLRNRTHILFMGDGELRQSLAAAGESSPPAQTHFLGFQNQRKMSPFYHAADVLVLPSLYSETWGLVVNEALHHGLPCVVSDAVGCAPDLIQPGWTGEIAEVNSNDTLASALQRAVKLVNRPEIRSACRARVGQYSTRKAAEGIAAAYQQATAT